MGCRHTEMGEQNFDGGIWDFRNDHELNDDHDIVYYNNNVFN